MFAVHAQNYFIDTVAFGLSLVPVALLSICVAASMVGPWKGKTSHDSRRTDCE
jgi:hypothetical protein